MLEVRAIGDSTLRDRLVSLIAGFRVLPTGSEVGDLAREYVRRGVFSPAMVVNEVNVLMGYPPIEILAPPEV